MKILLKRKEEKFYIFLIGWDDKTETSVLVSRRDYDNFHSAIAWAQARIVTRNKLNATEVNFIDEVSILGRYGWACTSSQNGDFYVWTIGEDKDFIEESKLNPELTRFFEGEEK